MRRTLLLIVLGAGELGLACASGSSTSAESFNRQNVVRFLPRGPDVACVFDVTSEHSGKGTYVVRVNRRRADRLELEVAGRAQRYDVDDSAIGSAQGGFLLVAPLEPDARWQGVDGPVELVEIDVSVNTGTGKQTGCIRTRERRRRAGALETVHTAYCPKVGPAMIEVERKTREGAMVSEKAVLRYCRDAQPYRDVKEPSPDERTRP